MNIVFCADRRALPGLHVAAYSLLASIRAVGQTRVFVFSDSLTEADLALLHQSLEAARKPFALELRRIDVSWFSGFPALNGSWATYFRLAVPKVMEVDRFLYVDADTLCDVNVAELETLDMRDAPAGFVPEAPLAGAADRFVAEQLGNSLTDPYYNAGVMLVNIPAWRRQRVTERAMDFIARERPPFHDQSALNVVLRGNALSLDERFNCIANQRKNWPALCQPLGETGRLIHFLDYPKPWDFLGEFVHPQYRLWRRALDQTAMKGFRSWRRAPSRKIPKSSKAWFSYRKTLKDRLLFIGFSGGWLKRVKGVAPDSSAKTA